ncbi:hypothetical protein [Shouchella clausii]|nr:hypothetical protein [Shouchella clausii]
MRRLYYRLMLRRTGDTDYLLKILDLNTKKYARIIKRRMKATTSV